ncbi:hypothetical protein [uncultured Cohaesibacter sp.]|uniref:hypothetical protein n=1 Tax=uncultured Cohaesibacter sp. TaxID=1002546 RepID=UPI002930B74B|nr:hypothetical protein [uncultured Cohaesibacter sp.]
MSRKRLPRPFRHNCCRAPTIITPNRFELNWLTQSNEENNDGLIRQAAKLGCQTTLVTSAFAMMRNAIANLLVTRAIEGEADLPILCEHPAVPKPQNGTGDMTAALFLARVMAGSAARSGPQTGLKRCSGGCLPLHPKRLSRS